MIKLTNTEAERVASCLESLVVCIAEEPYPKNMDNDTRQAIQDIKVATIDEINGLIKKLRNQI